MKHKIMQRIEQIRRGEVPEGYKKKYGKTIPLTWDVSKMKEICTINPLRPEVIPEKVVFLSMADVSEDGKVLHQQKVDYQSVKQGFTPFQKGDILVAKITPCFENGKGAHTEKLITDVGFGSTEFHVLRSKINSTYTFYHTVFQSFRKKLEREMTGSAGQKRVQTASLANYSITIPPVAEQQKIAAILTIQDNVIELKEKRLAEKLRQKKYLMQQLLTGKKRLPGYVGEWRTLPLKYLSEKQKKKNLGFQYSLVLSNSAQHGIVLQDQEFTKEIANAERIDGYYIVVPGAFVYNPRISISAPCGPINVNETGKTGIVSPLYIVFSISAPEIDQIFLKYYFQSSCWYKYVKGVANYGARHDRISISDEDFFEMPIPLPTKDEQTAIAQVLSTADREISLLRQDIEKEKQKKKALMQLLLTGIVRVNV